MILRENMKQSVKVIAVSALCAASVYGAGWKIPEQSLNAVAMSAANVANANGADASYYNPANMVWLDNMYHVEGSMTYINLPEINFDNASAIPGTQDEKSRKEDFLVPTGHIVSKEYYKNWRFGFSMVAPGGLSKRWQGAYAGSTADEFSIKILEANPTAAYKISDQVAIGFGLRAVYIEGKIRSDASRLGVPLARDMEADSIEYGYNLALSYRPTKDIKLAATYRSNVDLGVEGDATITYGTPIYSGFTATEIPLPATLNLAAAYTMNKTTVEFVYERVYWSKYKQLDFEYSTTLPVFDAPIDKNWEDTNTYRLGVSHQWDKDLTLMAGFAIDKTPAQVDTIGYELPDSDAKIYSLGFEYKIDKDLSIGMAYLYSDKDNRTVNIVDSSSPSPITTVQGEFSDASAHLVNMSFKYRF